MCFREHQLSWLVNCNMSPVCLEMESPPVSLMGVGSLPDSLVESGGLPDSLVSPYRRVVAVLREGRKLKDDTYL